MRIYRNFLDAVNTSRKMNFLSFSVRGSYIMQILLLLLLKLDNFRQK